MQLSSLAHTACATSASSRRTNSAALLLHAIAIVAASAFFSTSAVAQAPSMDNVQIGAQNIATAMQNKIAATTQVKTPVYVNGAMQLKTETFQNMSAPILSSVGESLKYMNEWKSTDNVAFAGLVAAITEKIQNDPSLSKNFRVTNQNGVTGISIGEPNIFIPLGETPLGNLPPASMDKPDVIPILVAIVVAFGIGYAIGTACVKLGPCNFAK